MKYNGNLPVLAEIIQNNKTDFHAVSLLIAQHIKKNTVEFVRLLHKAGFRDITIIGKPYSVDKEALKMIRRYAHVVVPTFAQLERVTHIGLIVKKFVRKQPFLCFDLGGHFSKYFQSLTTIPQKLLGVIEETKSGIWFDPHTLKIPLISVAESQLKNYGEVYFVARAILRNTEHILINEFQETLAGKNILVLGFGMIGRNLAPILQRQARVTIYDIKPSLRLKAQIDGFNVLFSLTNLSQFDIVIGVTGSYVLKQELAELKDGVILVNGSTRKKEFDFRSIARYIMKRSEKTSYTKISLTDGNSIHLLAHGYPVNFFRTESIPEYILDLVYSEMLLLSERLIEQKFSPGFYRVEQHFPEIEELVASLWLSHWGHDTDRRVRT